MSTFRGQHVFKRSGLISLSDLKQPEYQNIFSRLEVEQQAFLHKKADFDNPDCAYARDSLHHWSSIWEYPYAYYHLKEHAAALGASHEARVVDLGSAVRFIPFSVAKLGYVVHCLDIDANCGPIIERAAACVPHKPGKVDFHLVSNGRFPLEDGEVDALYCLSVLEHIPDFEYTIKEVFRVLKPNGLFILTMDLDLCGYADIGVSRYYDLRQCLAEYFDLKEPEVTIHPLDVLQPRNGPFPRRPLSTWQKGKFLVKQWMKSLLGKKPRALWNIAVCCAVMTKRSAERSQP